MPDIQITGSADELETEDDLIALFRDLVAAGWVGTVGVAAQSSAVDAPVVWAVNMMAADPMAPSGQKTLTAVIGDWKITLGSTVTAMTAAAYAATYGGTSA